MENHWITAYEFQEELGRAGSKATPEQIERWRREGLLPRPRQVGLGRGRGSLTKVPLISVAQTSEIERLLAIRRKRDWVGWQLWLMGFDVSDQYWRGPLETAKAWISEAQAYAWQLDLPQLETNLASENIKQVIVQAVRGTAFHSPLTIISAEYVETLGGFLQEILTGQFQGFSQDSNSLPNAKELEAVLITMGVKSKFAQKIADFAGSIETELQQISNVFAAIARQNSIPEPTIETRRELLAAIDIGLILHRNSKALIGNKALTTLNRIFANPTISFQAMILLLWIEYREISKTILPFAEIIEMQKQAWELV